jgi:hypothetical protein
MTTLFSSQFWRTRRDLRAKRRAAGSSARSVLSNTREEEDVDDGYSSCCASSAGVIPPVAAFVPPEPDEPPFVTRIILANYLVDVNDDVNNPIRVRPVAPPNTSLDFWGKAQRKTGHTGTEAVTTEQTKDEAPRRDWSTGAGAARANQRIDGQEPPGSYQSTSGIVEDATVLFEDQSRAGAGDDGAHPPNGAHSRAACTGDGNDVAPASSTRATDEDDERTDTIEDAAMTTAAAIPGSTVSNRFANITHKDLVEVFRAVISPRVVLFPFLAICVIEMRSGLASLVQELTLLVKWSVWFGIIGLLIMAVLFGLLQRAPPPNLPGGRESRDESDKATRMDPPVCNSAAHPRDPQALAEHEQHDRLPISGSDIHMDDLSCSSSVSCSVPHFNNNHDTSDVAQLATAASICSIEPFGLNATSSRGRIFINHTGQDSGARILTEMIWRDLVQEGYRCFFDAKSLEVGVMWKKCIEMHIQACDIFLCIVSKEWYYRHWCMRELNIACESKCKIIPLFMECGKVRYDNDFKGEFYRCHASCQKNSVNGTLIDQFWNNVINLLEIQTDRSINLERKGEMVDNVNIIKQWIIREMQRRRRRQELYRHSNPIGRRQFVDCKHKSA